MHTACPVRVPSSVRDTNSHENERQEDTNEDLPVATDGFREKRRGVSEEDECDGAVDDIANVCLAVELGGVVLAIKNVAAFRVAGDQQDEGTDVHKVEDAKGPRPFVTLGGGIAEAMCACVSDCKERESAGDQERVSDPVKNVAPLDHIDTRVMLVVLVGQHDVGCQTAF